MIKLCRVCGVEEEHSVRPNGQPQSQCKKCQREYSKTHYSANKEKHNTARHHRKMAEYDRMRKIIADTKDVPCADCGGKFPTVCMDFDHQRDKMFNIANLSQVGSVKRLLIEIDKCEVVCSNCHRIRTHSG